MPLSVYILSRHLCSMYFVCVCVGCLVQVDMSTYRKRQANLSLAESQMADHRLRVERETEVQL